MEGKEKQAENEEKVFDPRAALSEEQLRTLDTFKKRVYTPLNEDSPIWKEVLKINDKAEKKKTKRKATSTEPPEQRLWTAELTEKQEAVRVGIRMKVGVSYKV